MVRVEIQTVEILIRAGLLDDEHCFARREYRVELHDIELRQPTPLPLNRHATTSGSRLMWTCCRRTTVASNAYSDAIKRGRVSCHDARRWLAYAGGVGTRRTPSGSIS